MTKISIEEKVLQALRILKDLSIDCWFTFVRESSITADPILSFLSPTDLTLAQRLFALEQW